MIKITKQVVFIVFISVKRTAHVLFTVHILASIFLYLGQHKKVSWPRYKLLSGKCTEC